MKTKQYGKIICNNENQDKNLEDALVYAHTLYEKGWRTIKIIKKNLEVVVTW